MTFLCARRLRRSVLAASVALLSACTTSGTTFNTAGLNQIVAGRTTLDQASGYLGAPPVDVWRQGGSTLARWAYKGTIATDAVYFRQEAWLRFGPDGTFQHMEDSVNLPLNRRPRTAEEADRAAQAERDRAARQTAAVPAQATAAPTVPQSPDTDTVPVPDVPEIEPASLAIPPSAAPAASISGKAAPSRQTNPARKPAASKPPPPAANPLLPAGTRVIPGVTYPVQKSH